MRVQHLQDALQFLLLDEGRRYFVDLSLAFVLFCLEIAQHLPLRHVCLQQRDVLGLIPRLLIGNNLSLVPQGSQLPVQLLEFMVLILEQLLILGLNIVLSLQHLIPPFEEHLILVPSILHIGAHLLIPIHNLMLRLLAHQVLTSPRIFLTLK